jgi:outer membrane protein assembly factor BamB
MRSRRLDCRLPHRPATLRRLLRRRPAVVISALTLVLAAAAVATGVLPRLPVAAAHADDVTASQNDLRTGWDPAEPKLAPVSDGGPVGGPTFGQIFSKHLNGQIYAQPLVVGSTLIVATETNHVYGLNAATGAVEWTDSLGKPEPWTAMGCKDLTPSIGITSAPVYDPATHAVYLAALVDNGTSIAHPHLYTYALRVSNGRVLRGWPVAIQGSPDNAPALKFNPETERQRAGLLLLGGVIYLGFASYCDFPTFEGYVAGVNTSTRHLTLWTDEAGSATAQSEDQDMAGIWQGGSGLMSDGQGRIFFSSGNGPSPAAGPGTSPPPELGDSVVRLSAGAGGKLSAADFFSPADAPTLDADNLDFGSGGPAGLPFGTRADPAMLIQAGKDGRVFILNRDSLGGREQGPGGTDRVLAEAGPYAGLWGHPAAFGPVSTVSASSTPDFAYYVGKNDVLRYLRFGAKASGAPTVTDVADSTTTFGYTSGSPVVTSNGNDRASALVWEVYSAGSNGAGGTLDAFAAEPPKGCVVVCQMAPIWSAPIGTAAKFTIPATSNGRVYVGTRDGNIIAFGSPDNAPVEASPVNFGPVAVGKSRTVPVIITAAHRVRVRRISALEPAGSAPFKVKSVTLRGHALTFPVVLTAGRRLRVRVSFAPTELGGVTGALQVRTNATAFPVVSFGLTGQGT